MGGVDRFRVNTPNVAWDDFGDEIIMVNLETGQYFSTRDTGSEIWVRLAKGMPVAAVEQAIEALYDAGAEVARQAVAGFLAELQTHGLLVPDPEAAAEAPAPAAAAAKRAFVAPALDAYTDMQNLLLLDPIHEVDESGWPTQR